MLADVHANLAALEAVLERLPEESPDLVVCLGDTVGYNAQPRETLALIRDVSDIVIEGNHDFDSTTQQEHPTTGRSARIAIEYTRAALSEHDLAYLSGLPNAHSQHEFIAVHGCYLNDRHITGYVTSTMLGRNLERIADHDTWPTLALCGHTHVPMIGYLDKAGVSERGARGEVSWPREARAVLVNPGSVGQPRDQQPEASYCVIDTAACRARFERVPYPIEHTIAANTQAHLPEDLSHRLKEGR